MINGSLKLHVHFYGHCSVLSASRSLKSSMKISCILIRMQMSADERMQMCQVRKCPAYLQNSFQTKVELKWVHPHKIRNSSFKWRQWFILPKRCRAGRCFGCTQYICVTFSARFKTSWLTMVKVFCFVSLGNGNVM